LKVLIVSGYAENAAIGNGHFDPGHAVLTKPFLMTALALRVGEIIESWSMKFNDADVQAAFAPMMQAMARFNELAGNTLFSHESVLGFLTPQNAEDRQNRPRTESTRAAVTKSRASAVELCELMEIFLRLARQETASEARHRASRALTAGSAAARRCHRNCAMTIQHVLRKSALCQIFYI
jgi:hypothetical protein